MAFRPGITGKNTEYSYSKNCSISVERFLHSFTIFQHKNAGKTAKKRL